MTNVGTRNPALTQQAGAGSAAGRGPVDVLLLALAGYFAPTACRGILGPRLACLVRQVPKQAGWQSRGRAGSPTAGCTRRDHRGPGRGSRPRSGSFLAHIGHYAYSLEALRADLDRFAFLLSDGPALLPPLARPQSKLGSVSVNGKWASSAAARATESR
jgi:hypothetical protein